MTRPRAMLSLLILLAACGGEPGGPTSTGGTGGEGESVEGVAYVSAAVDAALLEEPAGLRGHVVFVSAPPGAYPGAQLVRLRNTANGAAAEASAVDGGFDPVALPGERDDEVTLEVVDSAGRTRPGGTVAARGKPRVLRVSGRARPTDTPLNFRVGAVFTTPVNLRSAQAGMRIFRDGNPVATRFERVGGSQTELALVVLEYDVTARYELRITTAIRDVNGEPIETGVSRTYEAPPLAPRDSITLKSFQLTVRHEPAIAGEPAALHYRNRQVEVGDSLLLIGEAIGRMPAEPIPIDVRVKAPVQWQLLTSASASLSADTGGAVYLRALAQGPVRVVAGTGGLRDTLDIWVTRLPEGEVAGLRVLLNWREIDRTVPSPVSWITYWYGSTWLLTTSPGSGRLQVVYTPDDYFDDVEPSVRADGTLALTGRAWVDNWTYFIGIWSRDHSWSTLGLDQDQPRCPRWSPDGTRLALGVSGAGGSRLEIMELDGSRRTVVRTSAVPCPAWAPDGERLYYVDGQEWNGTAALMMVDVRADGPPVELPLPGMASSPPVWSPAGGPSLAVLDASGERRLVVAAPDGSGYTVLDGPGTPTSWTSDGAYVLVTVPGWDANPEWVMIRRVRDGAMRAVLPGINGTFVAADFWAD